ncbi:MAG: glycosyltransferase N-terminal domain-containing protein [Thermodesulfobacteriota bacterium]|nr:glycosyltransferase N-terminal domain-containing protein [Thermodesulfobacteriota bacterium]
MSLKKSGKAALSLYNLAWPLALPALALSKRLRQGFRQRLLLDAPKGFVDLWIQAASAGEAFLAWELLKNLETKKSLKVLLTTGTSQGMEILEKTRADLKEQGRNLSLSLAYFPFDMPAIMEKAVERVSPRALVLLETEIWPGLLSACRDYGVPAIVINGRMRRESLAGYLSLGGLFARIAPEKVLAVSEEAAMRFGLVFGPDRVSLMPNMKFDRFRNHGEVSYTKSPLSEFLRPGSPLAVFGSIRQEEEPEILSALKKVHQARPKTAIGLFPRHMHRLDFWKKALSEAALPWVLRSGLNDPPPPGSIILWDTFGELSAAYSFAGAAFVGGSLRPLGGQNFLEPLSFGVTPVIGPYWDNFTWIGREILDLGLAHEVRDADQLAQQMIKNLNRQKPREKVREQALAFINERQGGTRQACELIARYIK